MLGVRDRVYESYRSVFVIGPPERPGFGVEGKKSELNAQSKMGSGSQTRSRILEEAARLFHEQGFAATGVATILRQAGVNSGSLYHFFPGKDAVLLGVLERHLGLLERTILTPAETLSEDPIERVFALLDMYRRALLVSGCRRGCPVGNLALEIGDEKPGARALIESYFEAWTDRVTGWLESAGDRLPPGLDRAALARLVLSVMEGGVMQARSAASVDPFDATVSQLRSLFNLLQGEARGGPSSSIELDRPAAAELEGARDRNGEQPSWAPAGSEEPIDASGWRAW